MCRNSSLVNFHFKFVPISFRILISPIYSIYPLPRRIPFEADDVEQRRISDRIDDSVTQRKIQIKDSLRWVFYTPFGNLETKYEAFTFDSKVF